MIDCSENTLSEHVVLSNELSGYIWKYFLDMCKIIGNLSLIMTSFSIKLGAYWVIRFFFSLLNSRVRMSSALEALSNTDG